jgi:hypothetical protein
LLGEGTTITDPETDKILAVIRPTVARLTVTQVVNDKLSKVELADPDQELDFQRGMMIEIERPSKTVMFVPPKWKSANANLKVGDEALYVTEHVLTELLRYGVKVISREQVTRVTESLAEEAGKQASDISPLEVAEALNAGVMITGELLAQANFGNVFLHATDVQSTQVLGILRGRIQRDKIKDAALEARKLRLRIEREIAKLPPLAIEMIRRTKILTQLIKGGCQVVIQVPNGAKVTYQGKKLPAPEVGFPPVFNFDWVTFYDGSAHLSALLAGLRLRRISYHLTDSKPEYFHVLNNRVQVVAYLHIFAPVEDEHIQIAQPRLTYLFLSDKSRLTGKWCVSQYLPKLYHLGVGGGVKSSELLGIVSRLPTSLGTLHLHLNNLTRGWVNFIPPSINRLSFDMDQFPQTELKRELLHKRLIELRNSPLFGQSLVAVQFHHYSEKVDQDQALSDELIESLFLSPNHHPATLQLIHLYGLVVSPDIKARLRARFPKAEIR